MFTASIGYFSPSVFQNFGLEYERYLKEVVNVLETDPEFKKKLEESNVTDIKVSPFYFIKMIARLHFTL